jgi:hypothetical protein
VDRRLPNSNERLASASRSHLSCWLASLCGLRCFWLALGSSPGLSTAESGGCCAVARIPDHLIPIGPLAVVAIEWPAT